MFILISKSKCLLQFEITIVIYSNGGSFSAT
nr:MAG TPA: hypothetical protein [Caudoviricetes sp.]